jgi:hypothetical protein
VRPNLDVNDGFASFALADGFAASDCVVVVVTAAFPRAFPRGEFTFGANALSRLTCTRSVDGDVVVVVVGTRPRPSPTAPGDSFARAGVDAVDACSAIARDARQPPWFSHGVVRDANASFARRRPRTNSRRRLTRDYEHRIIPILFAMEGQVVFVHRFV